MKTPTEYEIQFRAHLLLEQAGYLVRGELPYYNKYMGKNCRFDLVVINSAKCTSVYEFNIDTDILVILECKTDNAPDAENQIDRYSAQFPSVPVIEVRGMKDALAIVQKVESALQAYKKVGNVYRASVKQMEAAKQGIYKAPNYRSSQ